MSTKKHEQYVQDGRLSFEEFMGEQSRAERLFRLMDKDGDGYVTKSVNFLMYVILCFKRYMRFYIWWTGMDMSLNRYKMKCRHVIFYLHYIFVINVIWYLMDKDGDGYVTKSVQNITKMLWYMLYCVIYHKWYIWNFISVQNIQNIMQIWHMMDITNLVFINVNRMWV